LINQPIRLAAGSLAAARSRRSLIFLLKWLRIQERSSRFSTDLLRLFACMQLIMLSAAFAPAYGEEPGAASDPQTVYSQFGFSSEHRKQLDRGAIVSVIAEPGLRNELTGAVAMRLPTNVSEFAIRIRSGVNIIADPGMTEYGEVDPERCEADLQRAAFSRNEDDEAARLFRLRPGTEFNFSTAEIASIRERLQNQTLLGGESLAKASAAYRMVLAGRLRAYCRSGLDGIAAYDRGDDPASWPGKQLRAARATFPQSPALAKVLTALDHFPRAPPGAIGQHLFWKKTEVNGRPTFVLAHVLLEERPDSVVFVLREFYVGHSYNILQQIGIALPQGDGLVVFALNSTITDAVSGMFSGVARVIGQRRAREALEGYFEGIRRSVDGASAR
jgi:hypothetical protein